MTKTLVIGGGGFLGGYLVPRLLNAGHEVIVQDVLSTEFLTKLTPVMSRITFQWKSMLDIVPSDFDGIDNVALLASVTDVPLAIRSPHWTVHQNIDGIVTYLEAVKKLDKKPKTIFISSESVYGSYSVAPLIREEDPLHPTNIYGVSKAAAEMAFDAYRKQFKVPSVILRSTSMYGPNSRHQQVIPIFIKQALANKPLTMEGDGSNTRDFNYAGNMADAIMTIFDRKEIDNGVFNIGGGDDISILELGMLIINLIESDSEIAYKDWRPGEQGVKLHMSIDKAKHAFNYSPKVNLHDGLKMTIDWVRTL